ncbi:MAG: sugar phosphate isomerase/epimerase family protein [Sphaerochaetaceae bacterium]|jgi:sugar phosphate isomerase/epimerase
MNMQLGFRAHDFGKFATADELATVIETFQTPSSIQLALKKVIPTALDASDYTPRYIDGIRQALAAHGVHVAVIGCYINPVHPDPEQLEAHLKRFETHLKFNREFGCRIVGTETGSLNPDCSYHPDTSEPAVFDRLCRSIGRLLEAAVKYDGIVAVEAVSRSHTICSIARMVRLLEKFDTPHLRVIYDPVNLTPWTGIPELDGSVRRHPSQEAQRSFFRQALDAFGDKIVAIHAKDYVLDEAGRKIGDIPLGTGTMDWKCLAQELQERLIDVPVLLENLNPATLTQTLDYLRQF